MTSKSCAVIGVGFLGIRIAGELSRLGVHVKIYDHDLEKLLKVPQILQHQKSELVSKGLLNPAQNLDVCICKQLSEAVNNVDIVFEAVVENIDIKRWLYQKITHNCTSYTVICSNTLSMNIDEISSESLFKERILGCRFMTPVYCIPLVELTTSSFTSLKTVSDVDGFFKDVGFRVLRRIGLPRKLTLDEINHHWKAHREKMIRSTVSTQEKSVSAQETSDKSINTSASSNEKKTVKFDNSHQATSHDTTPDNKSIAITSSTAITSQLETEVNNITINECTSQLQTQSDNHETIDEMISAHNQHTISTDMGNLQYEQNQVGRTDELLDGVEANTEIEIEQISDGLAGVTIQQEPIDANNKQEKLSCNTVDQFTKGSDDLECVVCTEYIIDCVILPCAHMWMCYECAITLKNANRDCPACRGPIDNVIRVYKP